MVTQEIIGMSRRGHGDVCLQLLKQFSYSRVQSFKKSFLRFQIYIHAHTHMGSINWGQVWQRVRAEIEQSNDVNTVW